MTNMIKGKHGEKIAVEYLEKNGYKVLERNYRAHLLGEIDIIAKKNFTICAIEVKTRTGRMFGAPHEAITHDKLKKINMTFQHYLRQAKIFYLRKRIDAISVVLDYETLELSEIKWIKNLEV